MFTNFNTFASKLTSSQILIQFHHIDHISSSRHLACQNKLKYLVSAFYLTAILRLRLGDNRTSLDIHDMLTCSKLIIMIYVAFEPNMIKLLIFQAFSIL
jgi:hypothetical protein